MRSIFSMLIIGCCSTLFGQSKPNILFIIADDLRAELGCYGHIQMHTPHIDALAKSGVLFRKAFVQQAICSPSRSSFLTGMYPNQTQVLDNRTHFRAKNPDWITLPQRFKQAGYQTKSIGKVFHNLVLNDSISWSSAPIDFHHPEYGLKMQSVLDEFDHFLSKEGRSKSRELIRDPKTHQPLREERKGIEISGVSWEAPNVSDEYLPDGRSATAAIEFLQQQKTSKAPFFLAVGFHRPHLPYVAPSRYFDFYPPKNITLSTFGEPKKAPQYAFHDYDELREYSDVPDQMPLSDTLQKELKRAYFASVSYMDAQVGKLIKALKDNSLYDNTIIVFLGDHGYHLGDLTIWTKQTNFDAATNTPLIIKPIDKTQIRQSEALVECIDLYPTLCELAKISPPPYLSGQSFVKAFDEKKYKHRSVAFSQFPRGRNKIMGYSCRNDNFRLTVWIEKNTGKIVGEELYDYRFSKVELENVVNNSDLSDIKEELLKEISRFKLLE